MLQAKTEELKLLEVEVLKLEVGGLNCKGPALGVSTEPLMILNKLEYFGVVLKNILSFSLIFLCQCEFEFKFTTSTVGFVILIVILNLINKFE